VAEPTSGPPGPLADGADRLRVLAICESAVYGGAEAFFARVVEDLAASGRCSVTCAAPPDNEGLTAAVRRVHGVRLVPFPALPLRLAGLRLYAPTRLRRVRAEWPPGRYHVTFVNMPSPEHGASAVLADGAAARPAVGLLHIAHDPAEMGVRLAPLRSWLARRATRRLAAICALSPGAADIARRAWAGSGALVEVVPLPRPVVRRIDTAAARARLGLPAGPVLGIAGRIEIRQKGHDVFVAAARMLADRESPASPIHFAVAGAGPDDARLRGMAQAIGLVDRFTFLGAVTPVDPFLSAVDALAMPSNYEGVPLIALEALAARTPGVASKIAGLGDVWPAAWQVPRGDAVALAGALERVLSTPPAERALTLDHAAMAAEAFVSDHPGARCLEVMRAVGDRSARGG
jgi:glycosyltransferase involved in cell wall biosynthesis